MKRFTLAASGIALALAGAGSALALAAHPDHVLTRAEAQANAGRAFDRLDVNHDGKLDAADRAARFNSIFDRIDTNHDGQISRDEFLAAHEHLRGMMGPEHEAMGPQHMGPGHMDPGGPPPFGGPEVMDHDQWGHGDGHHTKWDHAKWGQGPKDAMLVFAILRRADPQHSGTVTREAFVNAALGLFDAADTNHDGKLTGAERKAAWAAARAHMRHEHGADHAAGDGLPPPPPLPPASPPRA